MVSGRARAVLVAVALTTVAMACGGTTTEQVIGPSTTRCQLDVSAPPATIPAAGMNVGVRVSTTRDCVWTASSDAAWVDVKPASGQGAGALALTIDSNAQTRPRSSTVVINDVRLNIAQEPAPCRFAISPDRVRIGSEGGRAETRVTTTAECEWQVAGSVDWARIAARSGLGAGTVGIEAGRNVGSDRSATISIAGLPFIITQEGSPPPPPVDPVCTFTIDPQVQAYGPSPSEGSFRVITQPGCSWSAGSGTDWINVGRSSGTGSGIVSYRVAINPIARDRSGTISAAGRTHLVVQQAAVQNP